MNIENPNKALHEKRHKEALKKMDEFWFPKESEVLNDYDSGGMDDSFDSDCAVTR